MRGQMVITHVQSGKRWANDVQEVDEDTFLGLKNTMKDHLANMQYIESANGDILPGDFIRQHCVITFIKVE